MPLSWLLACCAVLAAGPGDYFAISVVDDATGRGVPLVELRTTGQASYWTDSNGLVAFYEPDLMDQKVFFTLSSHGYEFPADGFGFRGKALEVSPGGSAELRVQRINVAERLYRVTGEGIYRDSVLLGKPVPIERPLLNAQVVGSDSVNSIVFQNQVYWFWGDTNRPAYPLGTFHVPGATSKLPADGGLDPARGVNLDYFTRDDGFAASTCEMPGQGPTWIDGLCVIDEGPRQRMFAKYVKVRKFLEVYERGLVEFDPVKQRFEKVATFDFAAPLYPLGHSLARDANGERYVYFGNPYPLVRVRAQAAALADLAQYETLTCQTEGSTAERPAIDRNDQGAPRWRWRHNVAPYSPQVQAKWIARGLLKPSEGILALRDVESGKPVAAHAGSVNWNPYRRRFVMIAEQSQGTSPLGEVWYAEADTPQGPWVYARKVVTHDKYSFYNPKHHDMLDADGGRTIYFEGTYSTFFSGNDHPTPRYDYNQIMYRLDLSADSLILPVPVYQTADDGQQRFAVGGDSVGAIGFMALDRPIPGCVAVVRGTDQNGDTTYSIQPVAASSDAKSAPSDGPAFYALPADTAGVPKHVVGLYDWRHANGQVRLAVAGDGPGTGFVQAAKPLCLVWRYPLSPAMEWKSPGP